MEDKEILGLYNAYLDVYELDEVTGFGGHIDPNTGKPTGQQSPAQKRNAEYWKDRSQPDPRRSKSRPGGGSTKPTNPRQVGDSPEGFAKSQTPNLAMTPADRMKARSTSLEKRGEGKLANKIKAVANRPNMNNNESYDLYDLIFSHLLDEGYADTEESATAIMVNMSEDWRQSIVEEMFDEEKKEFPSDKAKKQSAKHMRNYITRSNSYVGQRARKKSAKMDAIRSTVEVGDDPRNTMHGQDLRKI